MSLLSFLLTYFALSVFASVCIAVEIDMSGLVVLTVLDLDSPEIIRDGLTLLRSIRLFGGSMNEATIIVGIPIASNVTVSYDNPAVARMIELGAKIEYFMAAASSLPRTMNKFGAFAILDNYDYNYFLWLDADMVVVQDPRLFLPAHRVSGEIHCVPDIYSYMVRYPRERSNTGLWNYELPSFEPLGDEGVSSPYGMCNTGMLFFDSKSIELFMRELGVLIQHVSISTRDRFLDSLLFVVVLNKLSISVDILPFSMNYMAFFEEEIMAFTNTSDIVFAHFLTTTEFYCFQTLSSGQCKCMYYNSRDPLNSLILKRFESMYESDNCLVLMGNKLPILPPHALPLSVDFATPDPRLDFGAVFYESESVDNEQAVNEAAVNAIDTPADGGSIDDVEISNLSNGLDSFESKEYRPTQDTMGTGLDASFDEQEQQQQQNQQSGEYRRVYCTQLWPPVLNSIKLQISSFDEHLQFDIVFQCGEPFTASSKATDTRGADSLVSMLNFFLNVEFTTVPLSNHLNPAHNNDTTTSTSTTASAVHSATCRSKFSVTDGIPANGAIAVRVDSGLDCDAGMVLSQYNVSIDVSLSIMTTEINLRTRTEGILAISSRMSSGSYAYSVNQLEGGKSILLPSQLEIPTLLNDRYLLGSGAIICCQSSKGLSTTINIIKHWKHGFLTVLLTPQVIAANSSAVPIAGLESLYGAAEVIEMLCRQRVPTGSSDDHDMTPVEMMFPQISTVRCILMSLRSVRSSQQKPANDPQPVLSEFQISKSIRRQSLRFVYLDYYVSYNHYVHLIDDWYSKVRRGGLLVGSRFVDSMVANSGQHEVMYFAAKSAVQSRSWQSGVLVTYDEYTTAHCKQALAGPNVLVEHRIEYPRLMDANILNSCSPAWYLIRGK